MKKSINEIGYNWRLCGVTPFGGYEYVEIDIHSNNFRRSTKRADATALCKILRGQRGWYIRFRRTTWYLDNEDDAI